MRPGDLIHSEPFKAALRALGVFLVLYAVASWLLVRSVETTLRDDLRVLIQVETDLLGQIYRDEGRDGVIRAISELGRHGRVQERVYGLFD